MPSRAWAGTTVSRRYEAAEYHFRRAFDLNPYDADTLTQMGFVLTMRGRPVEALAWMDRAIRVNPIHPDWYNADRGVALYAAGEYAEAIASLAKVPGSSPWRKAKLASCHAQLGQMQQARSLMNEVRQLAPDFSPLDFAHRFLVYEHTADAEHVAEGIAKALAA
jgi:tetratricopeptide (TPR) repeat protein